MKIEPNIWPLWELNNGNLWNDRRNKLQHKMFQIISFITTYATFCFISIKEIHDELPGFEYGFNQDVEFNPGTETFSIISNPSSHHLFYRFYITENLTRISFLPSEVLLKFLGKSLIFLDNLNIFLKRTYESLRSYHYLPIYFTQISQTRPFLLFVCQFSLPLFHGQFCIYQPFIHFLKRKPWYSNIHHLCLKFYKRKMGHKFICRFHSGNIFTDRINRIFIVCNERIILSLCSLESVISYGRI